MSGKQSRKIRKQKGFSKKVIAGAAAAVLCAAPVATEGGEFLLSLYPHISFPVVKFDDSLSTGFGGGLRLTYRPVDFFNVFVQGDYKQYSFDTKQNVGNVTVLGGSVGAGYQLSITDRFGISLDAGVGYYNSKYNKGINSSGNSTGVQGFNVSGSLSLSYKLGPVVSVYAAAGANHYAYKNSKFITSVDVNPGLTVNLTKAFSNKNNVELGDYTLKPVFPVFYSWYNDNSFGNVEICNNEDAAISDVNVYFFQPQYMNQPKNCGYKKILKKGESVFVDLKAFFNEQMLSLNEKTDTMTSIIVEYKYLGAKRTQTFPMIVPVYGRNNMSWEDDRCASAFVSSKDPAAMWFAKYVVSTIRDDIRSGVSQNIQYAMGIFEALNQYGINYVKDPTSAFEDNVGTASIDFLQFPYQTLMYRGGDCDDLSILVCSLLESVGIQTAFITIPGHIYMAFDSGYSVAQAQSNFLSMDEFIVKDGKVWVPLEITLSDEGFSRAWHKGAWEWNTAKRNGTAMMYPMEDSWRIYKPVSVPGAVAKFTLPEETAVARVFSDSVDDFIIAQITPQIAWYENRIASAPTAQNYNDFGILYAQYGLFDQAEKQFRLARNKNYIPAVLNTANLYYSKKDYSSAKTWYKKVLDSRGTEDTKSLAMIGIARCAYEDGDYNECDLWYGTVYKNNRALARKYSYLGSFEQTNGRSFSLADRLENTVWILSSDYSADVSGNSMLKEKLADTATASLVQDKAPVQNNSGIGAQGSVVAVVPSNGTKENEENDKDDKTDGDGKRNSGGDDDFYSGISSQMDFNILSAEDLAGLAQDAIIENGETLDDFDASGFAMSINDDFALAPAYETEEVLYEKPVAIEPIVEPEPAQVAVSEPEPVAEPEFPVVPEPVEGPVEVAMSEPEPEPTPAVLDTTPDVVEPEFPEPVEGPVEVAMSEPDPEPASPVKQTIQNTVKAAGETVKAVEETVKATAETVKNTVDTAKAVVETAETVAQVTQTVTEAVKSVTESSASAQVSVTSPVETKYPEQDSSKPVAGKKAYIGFAALAGALAALFLGLKKRGKKDE